MKCICSVCGGSGTITNFKNLSHSTCAWGIRHLIINPFKILTLILPTCYKEKL